MSWHWTTPREYNGHQVPYLREVTAHLDEDELWPVALHFELRNEFEVWFVTMVDPDTGREIDVTEAVYPQRDAEFDQYLWDRYLDLVPDYD